MIWLASGCSDLSEVVGALKAGGHETGVVLVQDGVFLADKGCPYSKGLKALGVKVYASKRHLEERGISGRLAVNVTVVDYPDIVHLIMESYEKTISL